MVVLMLSYFLVHVSAESSTCLEICFCYEDMFSQYYIMKFNYIKYQKYVLSLNVWKKTLLLSIMASIFIWLNILPCKG